MYDQMIVIKFAQILFNTTHVIFECVSYCLFYSAFL